MADRSLTLTLNVAGLDVLVVTSDGMSSYQVRGTKLRHKDSTSLGGGLRHYHTDDDLHIVGEVMLQLGAHLSQEVLTRALMERG